MADDFEGSIEDITECIKANVQDLSDLLHKAIRASSTVGADDEPNWLDASIVECLATADWVRTDLENGDYTRLGNFLSDGEDDDDA